MGTLSPQVRQVLKEKLYMLYAQNYQKVGLLSNYKIECMNPKAIEVQSENDLIPITSSNTLAPHQQH
jgi:hypothetical protein